MLWQNIEKFGREVEGGFVNPQKNPDKTPSVDFFRKICFGNFVYVFLNRMMYIAPDLKCLLYIYSKTYIRRAKEDLNRTNRKFGSKRLFAVSLCTLAITFSPDQSYAQALSFDDALKRARLETPAIEARSLQIEAAQSAVIAADQLPDPKLNLDLLDQRIAGPHRFSPRPGRNGFPRQRIGISQ